MVTVFPAKETVAAIGVDAGLEAAGGTVGDGVVLGAWAAGGLTVDGASDVQASVSDKAIQRNPTNSQLTRDLIDLIATPPKESYHPAVTAFYSMVSFTVNTLTVLP
ncbi:MAG: hypothetical protein HYX90_09475 [Chloroflexi bacterium]|nr:hypothetical protein [Chloroflexota bacterium]